MNFLAFSSSELGDLKENEIFAEVNNLQHFSA